MTKRIILTIFILLPLLKVTGQNTKVDTSDFDTQNKQFIEFAGTWFDNTWDHPVMRGFSLSRTKKDSSRFSLTFHIDGRITSQNFRDSFKILDSTTWWYDGNFIYLKKITNSDYEQIRVFKYKEGNIVIAFKFTGKYFYFRKTGAYPEP